MTNHNNQLGLSLVEVLIAILIFSMVVIGLVNFQSVLVSELIQAKNRHQAQKIAFELLDCHPALIAVSLPEHWRYQVTTTQYNYQCKIVKIIITPPLGDNIIQQRWFCQPP